MRTRGHDAELTAGFLCAESFVAKKDDILAIEHCARGQQAIDRNVINVFLRPGLGIDPGRAARHGFVSSSCGICGKATIESVHQHHPPIEDDFTLPLAGIARLPERLQAAQAAFAQTGGLHAAAIFDQRLQLICLREDIGRHNAVDKVIGHGFLGGAWPFARHLLLVSGRASFEILQKALVARIAVIAAISAPSSLAVDFARESNQTLIGFLRGGSMNIYSSPERLT